MPLALHISDIPWNGPAAGIRVARVDGNLVVNPLQSQRARADLELVVTSGPEGLSMVEGEAREVPEAEVAQALFFAQDAVAPALEMMNRWREEVGREKRAFEPPEVNEELADELEQAGRGTAQGSGLHTGEAGAGPGRGAGARGSAGRPLPRRRPAAHRRSWPRCSASCTTRWCAG